jgi:hypothetical protein
MGTVSLYNGHEIREVTLIKLVLDAFLEPSHLKRDR